MGPRESVVWKEGPRLWGIWFASGGEASGLPSAFLWTAIAVSVLKTGGPFGRLVGDLKLFQWKRRETSPELIFEKRFVSFVLK